MEVVERHIVHRELLRRGVGGEQRIFQQVGHDPGRNTCAPGVGQADNGLEDSEERTMGPLLVIFLLMIVYQCCRPGWELLIKVGRDVFGKCPAICGGKARDGMVTDANAVAK
jgi:hypothetical protein